MIPLIVMNYQGSLDFSVSMWCISLYASLEKYLREQHEKVQFKYYSKGVEGL